MKAVTQRAKSLIVSVKGGRRSKDDVERSLEAIFGKGSSKEIEEAATKEKIIERIEEIPREKPNSRNGMRCDAKRRSGREKTEG